MDFARNNVGEMGERFSRVSVVLMHVSVKSLHRDHTVFSALELTVPFSSCCSSWHFECTSTFSVLLSFFTLSKRNFIFLPLSLF